MQFEKALQTLCDAGVEFVIIGGVSATFHGSARTIYDLDICYSRASSNLRRLASALAPLHPRPREFRNGVPFVWDQRNLHNGRGFTLQTDVAGTGTYTEVVGRSIAVNAFGRIIATLDLGSLIEGRGASGRDKDLAGLAELESPLEANGQAEAPAPHL
jgi:hypothetical protein